MRVDTELLKRYRLEPRSEREAASVDEISAADFSVWSTKLQLICDEAKEVLIRTGRSEATQAGDCIAGLYTASGDLAAATVGTAIHAATGPIPLKYVRKYLMDDPTVGVRDGDMFFFNETLCGGIHNPDQFTAMPIVWGGEVIAWAVSGGHVSETGATEPGGMVVEARSRYDEGLKAPPVKVGENFRLKRDVMDLLNNMVRDEALMEGEMLARAGACMKLRERVLELLHAQGPDLFIGLLRRCCEAAAEGSRRTIGMMLDGTFRQVMFMDSTGSMEGLVRIMITVRKRGEHLSIDLTGSSPELPAGSNCNPHVVRAALAMALCMYVMPDLPVSSGVYEPIEFLDPPVGTCVSASPEAGTSCGIRPAGIAAQGIHACLNRMMFATPLRDRIAMPFGTGGGCFAGGGPNQYGRVIAGLQCIGVMNGTGGGARPDQDGVDSAGMFWAGSGDSLDLEHVEVQLPNLYTFRMLAIDIAGAGKYRGGAPLAEAITIYDSPAFFMVPMVPSVRFPTTLGLFGGYAAACSAVVTMHGTDWPAGFADPTVEMPRSIQELWEKQPVPGRYELEGLTPGTLYMTGEGVAIAGEGGGGWGDVLDRDPRAVANDVRGGIYSEKLATNLFKVVLDSTTHAVDAAATEAARSAERQERLRRGRPYAEFVAEWSQLSPAPELLTFYGTWPEPDRAAESLAVEAV